MNGAVVTALLLSVLIVLLLLAAILVFGLHLAVNDRRVSGRAWRADGSHTVLAVFAHPDDEVMVSGTLAKAAAAGSRVHALYLTHGEDGPTGGLVEQAKLGEVRERELSEVSRILGYKKMEILSYPDRYLDKADTHILKEEIKTRIALWQPDTVICFDNTIGLYGHTDHMTAGMCTQEILQENPMGVKHLLVMTLPRRMIGIALKVSKTFHERYDAKRGLPEATLAVKMASFGCQKHKVVCAHKTQWQVMGDVQPLYDKIPYQIYYRIFSREYFSYSSPIA